MCNLAFIINLLLQLQWLPMFNRSSRLAFAYLGNVSLPQSG